MKRPSTRGARTRRAADGSRFVVLTGLSGAGKSQAIRALEDLGYFCVDNLPSQLIPTLAELSLRAEGGLKKVAIVVDVREGSFVSQFPRVLRSLRAMRGLDPTLIFLEASDATLVRRFSETRRPHPLAKDRPVLDGIREERKRLGPIRRMADETVDTTDLTVHELRETFMSISRGWSPRGKMLITFASFGFKHGVPAEADLVFDVRCLPNPHFVPELRSRTGRDRPVVRFMNAHEETAAFLQRIGDFLRFVIPHYVAEGKSYLTIAIGCTGGRHRSVMMAEALRRQFADLDGVRLRVRHRDIDIGNDLVQGTGGDAMIGVVVVTHGQLATELVNAAETIVGDLPQFAAVSIGWHDDADDAREEIRQAIARVQGPEGVLILTDMFGGTPSNLGLTFLEADRVEVITGVNLPMLIKLAQAKKASNLLSVARAMSDEGRNAIWIASDLLRSEAKGEG